MRWGEHREYLEGLREEATTPDEIPLALLDEPELSEELEEYLCAFFELAPGRVLGGFGPGGIPFADIAAYCRLFAVENPRRFVEYIRALDCEFLRMVAERSSSKA